MSDVRMRKRYRARVHRFGRCSVCQFREQGDAGYHCKKLPDRQGSCDTDKRLPVFRVDTDLLDELRDG